MNFIFVRLVWLFIWPFVTESSANILLAPLRISTRHFAPYMYQDTNGNFHNGMEFHFLQRMAEMLNVRLHFQAASNHSDVCNDVEMNIADICIGGIFPTEDTLKYALMSVTYASDDLTWCVQKAEIMPMFLAHMLYVQPAVWFVGIFGCGYPVGFLIYLLVQFDPKYKQRSSMDWHRTMLITLPAFIGLSPNFTPLKGTLRIFYATILISAFFVFQILFTRGYDVFHKQVPWHQVSSINEIMDKDFHLVGSPEALNLINRNKMISNRKIESFYICEDINECLVPKLENLAVAGSRQNMINSPSYSPLQMFCFDRLENIASYPIALYMRKDFPLAAKIEAIARQLLEAGFFVKWESVSQIDQKRESIYVTPLRLPITHISAALIFFLGCGSVISTSAFFVEKFVHLQIKRQRGNRRNIWNDVEQFFDGRRHYFKDVPERLQI